MTAPTGPDRTGVVARLDALEAAHKAASKGPWSATQDFIDQGVPDCTMTIHGGDGGYVGTVAQSYRGEDNAAAIVADHAAVPRLVAALTAVLDLHRPPGHSGHCPACHQPAEKQPCPTVAVVTAALGEA